MKIAILYQKHVPPIVDGIKKPMKEGGYSDSGADIAYCLKENGISVVTPVDNPDVMNNFDWVFPDTEEGIGEALKKGADTLWLNTVLYEGHPIEKFCGIKVIGQRTADASLYDDKYYTNTFLKSHNLPVILGKRIKSPDEYDGKYPCIIKPIRGRGSQGVIKCENAQRLKEEFEKAIAGGRFGDQMIVEPFLSGKEITVSVLPSGEYLPAAERFNHKDGIAPYNGVVAVRHNSRAITYKDENVEEISRACGEAVKLMGLKALIRVDCRADDSGKFKMFDFNLKPNMTGASRPHRKDQDCLTMISAEALGMSFFDLLKKQIDTAWEI